MPFFGGTSIYKQIGTNIVGGLTTLPINIGINNIGIGANVLQNNDTGDNNIGVGNGALNSSIENSANIAIGYQAAFSVTDQGNVGNVVIGDRAAVDSNNLSESVIIGHLAADTGSADDSIIIGSRAARNSNASQSVIIETRGLDANLSVTQAENSIIIGSEHLVNAASLNSVVIGNNLAKINEGQTLADSIVIGNSLLQGAETVSNCVFVGIGMDNSFINWTDSVLVGAGYAFAGLGEDVTNSVYIGHNMTVFDDNRSVIQIGDPNVTYDQIQFGDQAFTGGGGFPAEATQNAVDLPVSITSTSSNSGSGSEASYILFAGVDPIDDLTQVAFNLDAIEDSTGNQIQAFIEGQADPTNALINYGVGAQNSGGGVNFESGFSADVNNQQVSVYQNLQDNALSGTFQIGSHIDTGEIFTSFGFTNTKWVLEGVDETGADTATFTATNAPAAITPQKWLKIRIGGVDGWVPWFST